MQPHKRLVEYEFRRTVQVRDHVYFAGTVELPEHLLKAHLAEVEEEKRRQAAARAQEGMTATEISDFQKMGDTGVMPMDEARQGDLRPQNEAGLRTDGPTLEAWIKAGYAAENYPPEGYAAVESGAEAK